MSKYQAFENDESFSSDSVVNVEVMSSSSEGTVNFIPINDHPMEVRSIKAVGQSLFTEYSSEPALKRIPDPSVIDSGKEIIPKWQSILRYIVEHLFFRAFSFILIIVDISVLISDFSLPNKLDYEKRAYEITALCFVCYFILEVFLRMAAKGPSDFFSDWYNVVDLVVIIISFGVTVVYTAVDLGFGYAKLVIAGRLIRVVGFVRLWTERKNLVKGARQMISENKRRYRKDGFDLDLTYVTEQVIAMSFPSRGQMSLYRNPIQEVARFLDSKHKDHYKVYNLCSERTYDDTYFHGRVERFLIDDHNVPLVKDMIRFVRNVEEWLSQDKDNVIAVHCKGGKGRTGAMICIYLVQKKHFTSAEECLGFFGLRRTDLTVGNKFQGVETPSQNRYVGYFWEIKEKLGGVAPEEINLKLRMLKIFAIAGIGKGDGSDMSCEIFIGRTKVFECAFGSNKNCQAEYKSEADVLEVLLLNCPVLHGDVKLKFQCSSRNVPKGYEKCPFYFWFHTSFIENNRFYVTRDNLDNPHKPKTWNVFREKLAIELTFSPPDDKLDVQLR